VTSEVPGRRDGRLCDETGTTFEKLLDAIEKFTVSDREVMEWV